MYGKMKKGVNMFTLVVALATILILYILNFSNLDIVSQALFLLTLGFLAGLLFYILYTDRKVTSFFTVLKNELDRINNGMVNGSYCNQINTKLPDELSEPLKMLEEMKNNWRTLRLENQLLYDTARSIYSFSSTEDLLDTFTARLTSHFAADFGYLLLDNTKGYLMLKSTFGVNQEDMEKTFWAHGEGLSGTVVDRKEPILCFDVEEDPRYIRAVPGTKSLLIAPLLACESIAGVIVLGSFKKSKFSQSDLDLVSAISGEIGLAIENARLSGEIRDRMHELSTLYEATKAISSSVELDQVLQITVKYVANITNARSCSLMLIDESYDELYIRASTGLNEDTYDIVKLIVGQGIAGRVAQLGVPMLVPDIANEPQFVHFAEQKEGFKAVLSIPLISTDAVIGVINIDTNSPLSRDTQELIETLASKAAVAVENAMLYQNMKELATRDGLTGLYNHRYFRERLEEEIFRAERYGHPLSLVMIDIDNFKLYNDKYGHPTGDAILQELAGLLSEQVRAADVVARYGGEEFVIILPETMYENAYLLVERLRMIINEHEFGLGINTQGLNFDDKTITDESCKIMEIADDKQIESETLISRVKKMLSSFTTICNHLKHSVSHITISAGICSYPDKAKNMEELISKADQALLEAKKSGKNEVLIYPSDNNNDQKQEQGNQD